MFWRILGIIQRKMLVSYEFESYGVPPQYLTFFGKFHFPKKVVYTFFSKIY